jgi:hypothetical protein
LGIRISNGVVTAAEITGFLIGVEKQNWRVPWIREQSCEGYLQGAIQAFPKKEV